MIVKSNNVYRSLAIQGAFDKLPLGFYQVGFSPESGFFLSEIPPFTLPEKLYGDFKDIDRWIKARECLSGNMAILLMGIKGSGKSLEAKKFCLDAKKPVIVISEPFGGSGFNSFISNPAFSDSIIFIDEFEKIYKNGKDDDGDTTTDIDAQQGLLSLMDGVFKTKLTFVLTTNGGTVRLNENMFNRPGRIRYYKNYTSLSKDIIDAVIDDMLVKKIHKDSILKVNEILSFMTFDILTSLIEDINIFDEPADVAASKMCLISEKSYFEVTEHLEHIGSFKSLGVNYWGFGSTLTFQRTEEFSSKINWLYKHYEDETITSPEMMKIRSLYSKKQIEKLNTYKYIHINEKKIDWSKILKEDKTYILKAEVFKEHFGTIANPGYSIVLTPDPLKRSENPFVI